MSTSHCSCYWLHLSIEVSNLLQAIDIWMGACTAFIFAALLEFTLTNHLWRRGKKGHHLKQHRRNINRNNANNADGMGENLASLKDAATAAAAAAFQEESYSENGGRGRDVFVMNEMVRTEEEEEEGNYDDHEGRRNLVLEMNGGRFTRETEVVRMW